MTKEPIMIDDVDVAECNYYADGKCTNSQMIQSNCKNVAVCYYKEYKRKEKECEELKKANKHIDYNRNQKADKLMKIERLITACSTGYTDEFIQELLVILHEPEPINLVDEISEVENDR